jgi:hypothetical protein
MVFSPTERNLTGHRKRILRIQALRYEIGGFLLRIEKVLVKCIREFESQGEGGELRRKLIVRERG